MEPENHAAYQDHAAVVLYFGNFLGLLPIDPKGYSDICARGVAFAIAPAIGADG